MASIVSVVKILAQGVDRLSTTDLRSGLASTASPPRPTADGLDERQIGGYSE
jgi:hypothetical protein